MRRPFVRDTVARSTATIGGGRALHTWNDLLGVVPGRDRRQDRPHDEAGWSQVAAVRADTGDDLRDDPRQPVAHAAERRPRRRCSRGASSQYRIVDAVEPARARTPRRSCRTGAAPLAARRREAAAARRAPRAGRSCERVVAPIVARAAGASAGRSSAASRSGRAGSCSAAARSSPPRPVARPGLPARLGWYASARSTTWSALLVAIP